MYSTSIWYYQENFVEQLNSVKKESMKWLEMLKIREGAVVQKCLGTTAIKSCKNVMMIILPVKAIASPGSWRWKNPIISWSLLEYGIAISSQRNLLTYTSITYVTAW